MHILSEAATVGPNDQGRMVRHVAALLVLSIAATPVLALGSSQAVEPPKDAAPLSAVELLQLYGHKTWKWGEGGAYFDLDGRKFRARTVSDQGETTNATGTWKITDAGKLCFTAKWGGGKDIAPAETCFAHVANDGDIYQRRLPNGGWYVFKHAETDPADEYSKFVSKDLVSVASTTN